jgi:hypothetical protein
MTTLLRRTLLTAPPLVLAGVLLKHPNDEGETIYQSVSPSSTIGFLIFAVPRRPPVVACRAVDPQLQMSKSPGG